jgi:hypothetical protein
VTAIYQIVNTANGGVYIGQTSQGCQKRWKQHLYLSRRGDKSALQNAIRKYGDDQFRVELLCEVEDEQADFVEMLFIAAAKSYPPSSGYGYNSHPGGKGQVKILPMDTVKYGRLSILKMKPRAMCVVQCDCGSESKTVAYDSLVRGKTKSCGCIRREMHHRHGHPGIGLRNIVLDRYKRRSQVWALTDDQFSTFMQSNCYYCGAVQSVVQQAEWTTVVYAHNEICCKDDSRDFVFENVLPCCKTCLFVRKKMSHEQFMGFLLKAGNHQMSKNSMRAGQ